MKNAIFVATCVAALSTFTTAGAFAQTGPAAQQDTMSKDKMGKEDAMKKQNMGTTGMNKDGMAKDGMSNRGASKEMSKDGSPTADTIKKKDGMSK